MLVVGNEGKRVGEDMHRWMREGREIATRTHEFTSRKTSLSIKGS